MKFLSGFRLELKYISPIVSIRSNLTHLHGFQQLVMLPEFIEMIFSFVPAEKSSESKVKCREASNYYKRVLDSATLAYATKTKEFIFFLKLVSWDFWQTANSVLNKGILLYLLYKRSRGVAFYF